VLLDKACNLREIEKVNVHRWLIEISVEPQSGVNQRHCTCIEKRLRSKQDMTEDRLSSKHLEFRRGLAKLLVAESFTWNTKDAWRCEEYVSAE
jgi:hypothetical protein